jgi:ADP-heptose:LPS heptosyltransferase
MYDGLYERETNHISQNLLGMLKLIGIKDFDDQMGFPLSEKSIAFAEQFTAPYRDYTIVGLNTDATDLERMISDQDMISVYNELIKKIDNLIVLLFCTPDKYLHFSELKKQHNMSKLILEQGTKGFFDAAAMVKFVDVMISTDTSFIHIASALDTPTVGIYQNEITHIKYWGPRSSLHTVITPELPGRTTRGFKPAEVANAASNLLHEKRLQSAARDQI